jgi:hypothetical protein
VPDYAAIANRAAAKLKEYGKSATVQAPATGGGWDGGGTRPDPVTASFFETGYSITHRNETAVQAGDLVGLLEADAGAVEAGWTLTVNGADFEIVDAQPLQPGDTRILSEVIARR